MHVILIVLSVNLGKGNDKRNIQTDLYGVAGQQRNKGHQGDGLIICHLNILLNTKMASSFTQMRCTIGSNYKTNAS